MDGSPERKEQMAAAQRPQHRRRAELGANAVGPGAGGIDDGARVHLAAEAGTGDACADDLAAVAQQALDAGVVDDARAVPLGFVQDAQDQARVVGLGVEKGRGAEQATGGGMRREPQRFDVVMGVCPPPNAS
jgi:hypothetical protein